MFSFLLENSVVNLYYSLFVYFFTYLFFSSVNLQTRGIGWRPITDMQDLAYLFAVIFMAITAIRFMAFMWTVVIELPKRLKRAREAELKYIPIYRKVII